MSAKKAIHFDEEQYCRVAVLRAPSTRLRAAGDNTIVEDPPLLDSFGDFIKAVSNAVPPTLRLGEVRVTEGAYVCDMRGVGDMTGVHGIIVALLDKFRNAAVKLEINAEHDKPSPADACGVGDAVLAVLEATSAMKKSDYNAEVALVGGETLAVSAPSENALTALPARNRRRDKKVDGEITGVGFNTKNECWIQVGYRSMFLAPMLTLDAGLELLRQRMIVTCKAVWNGQDYVLIEPAYAPKLNFDSSG